jgi:hypothetical protein
MEVSLDSRRVEDEQMGTDCAAFPGKKGAAGRSFTTSAPATGGRNRVRKSIVRQAQVATRCARVPIVKVGRAGAASPGGVKSA